MNALLLRLFILQFCLSIPTLILGQIKWTNSTVKLAAHELEIGKKTVTVNTKPEAEELFLGLFLSWGVRNSDGFNSTGAKKYFRPYDIETGTTIVENYYHWDNIFEFRRFDSWEFTETVDDIPINVVRPLTPAEIKKIQEMVKSIGVTHLLTAAGVTSLKNHNPFQDIDSFIPHLQIHIQKDIKNNQNILIFKTGTRKIFFK
ncbi:MAG: hypothetical protein RL329_610 [Bacteroidota bacterium]|jgi:hypothetical protein